MRYKLTFSLVIIFAIGLHSSCSKPVKQKTGWDEYELRGKVRTLCIKNYDTETYCHEITARILTDSTVLTFSEDGKLEQIVEYDYRINYVDGIRTTCVFVYRDNLVAKDTYQEDSLVGRERIYYTYDDKGRIIEENDYEDDQLIRTLRDYVYNRKGLVEEFKCYRGGDRLLFRVHYTYDKYGREIVNELFMGEGTESSATDRTEYNERGFKHYSYFTSGDEEFKEEYIYEYDIHENYEVKTTFVDDEIYIQKRTIAYYDEE